MSATTRCGSTARPPTPPCAPATGPAPPPTWPAVAELINRGPGLMATDARPRTWRRVLAEARALAGDDLAAQARLPTAEAFAATRPTRPRAPERAIALARDSGDPLAESAALDRLTAVQLARGEVRARAAHDARGASSCWRRCR